MAQEDGTKIGEESTSDHDAKEETSDIRREPANPKQIASRGVPSSESIYLPRHDSPELRSFQDKNESITRNTWGIDEITNFIFSKKYQTKYYEIAHAFMKLLYEKTEVDGTEIAEFVKSNSISKATFYNRVLPRLKRVGMVKVERDTIVAIESKRKYRPMRISLSKTFGNYFMKIGDSWLAIVDDARSRKDKNDQLKL